MAINTIHDFTEFSVNGFVAIPTARADEYAVVQIIEPFNEKTGDSYGVRIDLRILDGKTDRTTPKGIMFDDPDSVRDVIALLQQALKVFKPVTPTAVAATPAVKKKPSGGKSAATPTPSPAAKALVNKVSAAKKATPVKKAS